MAELGKKNRLRVVKKVDFGFYLDGGAELGEILIPKRYTPPECAIGDELEVFLYFDSEDRVIATTEEPLVHVDECAYLEVVDRGDYGAFLNWGLPKDLLASFKEQRVPMQVGKSYVVYVYLDASGRIAASSKLSLFLQEENSDAFNPGQMVSLLVASRSDIGYKAVIENTHLGIIHANDILQPIRVGERLTGYIKTIRDDDRIDLMLQPRSRDLRDPLAEHILDYITAHGGLCPLTDKSPPEDIYKAFRVSKANFKKAIGKLYKERRIVIEKDGLRLV